MWEVSQFWNPAGQDLESGFRHRARDAQALREEAELGVFGELQVSVMPGGQASGLERHPGELGLRVAGATDGLEERRTVI